MPGRGTPWTDEDERQLRKLHAQGLSLHAISQEMERSRATIHKYAALYGLSFDRAKTAAAAEAHHADAKARRAKLAVDLLADAERLRVSLWQPAVIFNFGGRDNTYEQRQVDEPPVRDKRDIIASVQTAIAASLRLDEYDSGESDTINSLLGTLFSGLQATHGNGDDSGADA